MFFIWQSKFPRDVNDVSKLCIADVGDGTRTHAHEWRMGPVARCRTSWVGRC